MTAGAAVLLALAAGLLFALGNQCSRLALAYTDSRTAALAQIGIGAGVYWLVAPLYLQAWYWTTAAALWFALCGLLRPAVSANLGMAGTRVLGPTVSSTVSATAPLFGIAFGLTLLGESLSWHGALGTAFIIAGVVGLSTGGAARRGWPLLALALPIGAAAIRSLTHGLAKLGLAEVPDPFFVALLAYTVSLPLAATEARMRTGRVAGAVAPGGLRWLVAMGIAYAIAVLALNTALLHGELVVVSPIVACSPVFTLLLGRWVFGEGRLGVRVALSVAAIVPGVVLVGLNR